MKNKTGVRVAMLAVAVLGGGIGMESAAEIVKDGVLGVIGPIGGRNVKAADRAQGDAKNMAAQVAGKVDPALLKDADTQEQKAAIVEDHIRGEQALFNILAEQKMSEHFRDTIGYDAQFAAIREQLKKLQKHFAKHRKEIASQAQGPSEPTPSPKHNEERPEDCVRAKLCVP